MYKWRRWALLSRCTGSYVTLLNPGKRSIQCRLRACQTLEKGDTKVALALSLRRVKYAAITLLSSIAVIRYLGAMVLFPSHLKTRRPATGQSLHLFVSSIWAIAKLVYIKSEGLWTFRNMHFELTWVSVMLRQNLPAEMVSLICPPMPYTPTCLTITM